MHHRRRETFVYAFSLFVCGPLMKGLQEQLFCVWSCDPLTLTLLQLRLTLKVTCYLLSCGLLWLLLYPVKIHGKQLAFNLQGKFAVKNRMLILSLKVFSPPFPLPSLVLSILIWDIVMLLALHGLCQAMCLSSLKVALPTMGFLGGHYWM